MACLRLLTFWPLPDLKVPSLCSSMTLWILRLPLEPDDEVFFAIAFLSLSVAGRCEQLGDMLLCIEAMFDTAPANIVLQVKDIV